MQNIDLYSSLYSGLLLESSIIVFKKKDNSTRVMICTKNNRTISMACGLNSLEVSKSLGAKESKANSNNGYLVVFDLEACDSRLVNTNTVIETINLGILENKKEIDEAFDKLLEIKAKYAEEDKIL